MEFSEPKYDVLDNISVEQSCGYRRVSTLSLLLDEFAKDLLFLFDLVYTEVSCAIPISL
jgi:hypothetical protein